MAHIHEKIDFTASVYIVRDGKVLLHKHKKLGIWVPPGGHVELVEDPNEAAVREAKEECGLDVRLVGHAQLPVPPTDESNDLIPPRFLNRHPFNESHEHIDFVYFGVPTGGEVAGEEGNTEIGWFTREDVEGEALGLKSAVRAYALAALDELG